MYRPLVNLALLFLLPPVLWANTKAGEAAYFKQDWPAATIRRIRRTLTAPSPNYLQAAERGHPIAEWSIADAYERGEGVEPNQPESVRWLQLAVEDGVTDAQRRLASRYESGAGAPQDSEKAASVLSLARGDLDAAFAEFAALAHHGVASTQHRRS